MHFITNAFATPRDQLVFDVNRRAELVSWQRAIQSHVRGKKYSKNCADIGIMQFQDIYLTKKFSERYSGLM